MRKNKYDDIPPEVLDELWPTLKALLIALVITFLVFALDFPGLLRTLLS